MPTSKPRITITLEPRAYEILQRLSSVQEQSMSSIVTQFLDVAAPQMERMVVILERAKQAPHQARKDLREALDRAEARVLPVLLNVMQEQDFFLHEHGAELVPATEETPPVRRRKGGATPVPVTRGVGRPKVTTKGRRHGRL